MRDAIISKLIEIKEKVEDLKAVKCRVNHERVLTDKETGLPLSKYIGEKVYERIGFCPREVREQRISCGHTNAPDILKNALTLLDSEGKDVEILRTELMNVITQIHLLDHRKGDAEKQLAILIEKKNNLPKKSFEKEISPARDAINDLENEHRGYVDKIAEVRDRIVAELETIIKEKNKPQNF